MIIDSYMENGFYSTGNSVVAELADIVPEDYSSCATVDEACMTAYLEMTNEYSVFETALREAEIAYVQEHGVAPVYEAVNIKELANQAIEHVKSWVAKMMGVLDRFMKEVAAKIATARTKLFKGNQEKFDKGTWTKEMDFEDLDYRAAINDIVYSAELISAEDVFKGDNTYKNDNAVEDYIKIVASNQYQLGDDTTISVKAIRDANLSKVKVNKSYVDAVKPIQIINDGFKEGLAAIKKEKDRVKKSASKTIKAIKDAAKDSSKDEKKVYNKTIKAVSTVNGTNNIFISAKLSILMGYLNQAYKIAGMMYKSGKKSDKKDDKKNDAKNAATKIVGSK